MLCEAGRLPSIGRRRPGCRCGIDYATPPIAAGTRHKPLLRRRVLARRACSRCTPRLHFASINYRCQYLSDGSRHAVTMRCGVLIMLSIFFCLAAARYGASAVCAGIALGAMRSSASTAHYRHFYSRYSRLMHYAGQRGVHYSRIYGSYGR